MTLTVGTRRRAAEFARALDGEPTEDHAIAGLVALTERLEPVPVEAAPPFRAALRRRLVAVAAVRARAEDAAHPDAADRRPAAISTAPHPTAPHPTARPGGLAAPRHLPRRSIALGALAAVTTVAGAGVGVAGSRALPGDLFYGVKRAAESVQLQVAGSDAARGTRYLQFAATRLGEVEALARDEAALPAALPGRPVAGGLALTGPVETRVVDTLRAMDEDTRRGTRLLSKAYGERRERELADRLSRFHNSQRSRLAALVPVLPADAQPQAAGSLALLTKVGKRADALHANIACKAGCPGGDDLGAVPNSPKPTPVTVSPTPPSGPSTRPPVAPVPPSAPESTTSTSDATRAPVAPTPTSPSTGSLVSPSPAPPATSRTGPTTAPVPTTPPPRPAKPAPPPSRSPSRPPPPPSSGTASATATEGGPGGLPSGLSTPFGPGLSLPPAGPRPGTDAAGASPAPSS